MIFNDRKIKFAVFFLAVFVYLMPLIVLAQAPAAPPAQPSPQVQPLTNPLSVNDPRELIGNIIKAIMGITGSIALAIFVYGGFTWMTSAGSPERVRKGREMIVWAVLGLAIIFLSYTIIFFVLSALIGGGGGNPVVVPDH